MWEIQGHWIQHNNVTESRNCSQSGEGLVQHNR